jgi:RNA polymerase sigma factor (sigma-70 family)
MTPRRLIEPARLAGTALLHTQTDERLVDLTRAGNGRAFEAIVTRYRKQLLRYCGGLLPAERAEDAVQQAFLNAYRAITAGEAELKLRPWLYRIAHNASLNLLRQNGWNYDQIPEDFDGVMQPPQAVEQSERIREVIQNVQGLPERQRDAIVLRELEGRSYDEIGVALGVTDGAVRQLLNRARTTLRAAATAVTPPQLVGRLAERGAVDAPTTTRIAEIAAGAGGIAGLAKAGAALVVAGAVAGGVVTGRLDPSADGHGPTDVAEAAQIATAGIGGGGGGDSDAGGPLSADRARADAPGRDGGGAVITRAIELARQERARRQSEPGDDRGGRHESGEERHGDDGGHSGPGGGGDDGGHSGPGGGGDGGHSGPGGGGDDGGRSGSGSGTSGGGGGDNSGPGSGTSDGGGDGSSSGPGPGLDDGGSSDSGSGTSGSGTSGSGTSGSGTGDGDLPELDGHSGPG